MSAAKRRFFFFVVAGLLLPLLLLLLLLFVVPVEFEPDVTQSSEVLLLESFKTRLFDLELLLLCFVLFRKLLFLS